MRLRTRCRTRGGARQGSALIISLLVVSSLLTIGLAIASVSVSSSNQVSSRVEDQSAMMLAEAGVAEALAARSVGGTGIIGSMSNPTYLNGGLLWVDATDLGNGTTEVVSNAMKDGGRAAVQVIVGEETLWGTLRGVSSNETPVSKTGLFLDSYDSRDGDYASQLGSNAYVNGNAVFQSNSDVGLSSNSNLYGDLRSGPNGTTSTGANTQVTGALTPLMATLDFPSVTVPEISVGGALSVSGSYNLPPGDYGFSTLEVEKNAELTINGPARIVVTGEMVMKRADLIIDPTGGAVEIYLAGDFSNATMATITTVGEDPTNLSLYLTGDSSQRADLHPHGKFHGTIYGPNAIVDLGTDFELYGAVAARRVELQPHNTIHFDEALMESSSGGQTIESVLYWAPTDLGDLPSAAKRTDPFALLGVHSSELSTPGTSWDGVHVNVSGGSN